MIGYRHSDRRFPFLWEDSSQPAARWHAEGQGPAQYFADTPDGAWAEFLRHEAITDEADLEGVERALWAVELGQPDTAAPALPEEVCRGGLDSYSVCQTEARRLRDQGATGLRATSGALKDGAAGGFRVERGLRPGPGADGEVVVLFGRQPNLVGWLIVDRGRPRAGIVSAVRQL